MVALVLVAKGGEQSFAALGIKVLYVDGADIRVDQSLRASLGAIAGGHCREGRFPTLWNFSDRNPEIFGPIQDGSAGGAAVCVQGYQI
jgi:hypothetical protein